MMEQQQQQQQQQQQSQPCCATSCTTSKPTLSYSKYANRSTIYRRNEWRRNNISDVRIHDPRHKVLRILSGLPLMNQIFEPYENTQAARSVQQSWNNQCQQQSSSSLSDDLASLGSSSGSSNTFQFNKPTVIDFSGGIPPSS